MSEKLVAELQLEIGNFHAELKKAKESISNLESGMKSAHKSGSDLGNTFKGMFASQAAFAGLQMFGNLLKSSFDKGVKLDDQLDELRIGFQTAGVSAANLDSIMKSNEKTTAELSDKYAISKGTIRDLTSTYLKLGGTTDDLANKQELIIGLSKRAGIGYDAAAKMLMKSTDPEVMGNLTKLGIKFDKNATDAERFQILTEKISPTLKSMADASNDSVGALDRLKNTMSGIQGTIGLALLDAITPLIPVITQLADFIKTAIVPMIKEVFKNLQPIIESLTKSLSPIIGSLLTALKPILKLISDLVVTLLPPIMRILQPIIDLISPLVESVIVPLVTVLLDMITTILTPVVDILNTLMPLIKDVLLTSLTLMTGTIKDVWEAMKPVVIMLLDIVKDLMPALMPLLKILIYDLLLPNIMYMKALGIAMTVVGKVLEYIILPLQMLIDWFVKLADKIYQYVTPAINSVMSIINGIGNTIDTLIGKSNKEIKIKTSTEQTKTFIENKQFNETSQANPFALNKNLPSTQNQLVVNPEGRLVNTEQPKIIKPPKTSGGGSGKTEKEKTDTIEGWGVSETKAAKSMTKKEYEDWFLKSDLGGKSDLVSTGKSFETKVIKLDIQAPEFTPMMEKMQTRMQMWKDSLLGVAQAFGDAASQMADSLVGKTENMLGKYGMIAKTLSAGFDAVGKDFNKRAKKTASEYSDLVAAGLKDDVKTNEKREKMFAETASAIGSNFAALALSGKATLGDFVGVLIDSMANLLVAQLPVWLLQVFATSTGQLGIAGVAVAAGLSAAILGLAAVAKSALSSAKGAAGGEDLVTGIGTETSDSNPYMLSVGEGVLKASANKRYPGLLKYLNKDKGLHEYLLNEHKGNLMSDNVPQPVVTEHRLTHKFAPMRMQGDQIVAYHQKTTEKEMRRY